MVHVRDIAMDILRDLGDAPSVDDWARKQTSMLLPYEKLQKLKSMFFYKLPSPKVMIASNRRRTAYMETNVPSGKAMDRVVRGEVIDEVTEEQLDSDLADEAVAAGERQVVLAQQALHVSYVTLRMRPAHPRMVCIDH